MGREEGHESVEKKEVNQDSETSHSQGRKGYHLKKKKKRLPPSDCGWLGQMLARIKQNEDYKIPTVFRNKEDISDSSGKNFSGAAQPRLNAVNSGKKGW